MKSVLLALLAGAVMGVLQCAFLFWLVSSSSTKGRYMLEDRMVYTSWGVTECHLVVQDVDTGMRWKINFDVYADQKESVSNAIRFDLLKDDKGNLYGVIGYDHRMKRTFIWSVKDRPIRNKPKYNFTTAGPLSPRFLFLLY